MITFQGTLPGAVIWVGEEERSVSLAPKSWPAPECCWEDSAMGRAEVGHWRWELDGGFVLKFVLKKVPGGTLLRAGLTNQSQCPVLLDRIILVDGGEVRRTDHGGTAGEWVLADISRVEQNHPARWSDELPSKNEKTRRVWKAYQMPIPYALPTDEKSNDGRWRAATDGFSVTRDGGDNAMVMQAVGPGEVELEFEYFVTPEALTMHISAPFRGVRLDPGETRWTDELAILQGNWQECYERALRRVAETHGARVGPAKVGWCSWYDLLQNVTAASTHQTAGGLLRLQDRLSLDYFQLDDGYQRTVGDWRADERAEKFPGGLAPFVEEARTLGASPGIWLAPLAVHESSPLFQAHPEWMQKNAQGEFSSLVNNWGPVAHWMDPTHPGAREWIRELLLTYREMGFTYFKIDFTNLEGATRWHDRKKTRLQVYRELYALYREVLGEECHILACGAFTLRAPAGYAEAFRTGPDSGAVWEYGDYPCSIGNCVRSTTLTAPANGILFRNDPDVTYLRPRDTLVEHERRSWHGFVGLLGGLVAVSEPMGRADFADAAPMLQMLTPPVPERGLPLHGGADPEGRLFGFTARRPFGDFAVVQLHNPKPTGGDAALNLADTGLHGPLHVWSFWDNRYLGIEEGQHVARELPSRGARIVRLSPLSESVPVLVGSNLHIGCGAAEVAGFEWDAPSRLLTIQLVPHAGRDYGAIWFVTPWKLPPIPLNDAIRSATGIEGQLVRLDDGLHVLHIHARGKGAQSVTLHLPAQG